MSIPASCKEYRDPKHEGFHKLVLQEAQTPSIKGSEVLVKVHAVSLQFRDLMGAKGIATSFTVKQNVIPCSDMAGEVVKLVDEVTTWKIGDRVCANFTLDHLSGDIEPSMAGSVLSGQSDGVLTQYKALPARSLVAIPTGWSFEEASTLPCAALTAYNALHGPIPVKAGDTVLVQGTGGVSIFGLQFAVASGATVIATSSSDEKLKIVSQLGARHVINYRTTPDWDQEVLKITGGRGVDHIIEVGGAGTLPKSLSCVRMAGWVHTIGSVGQGESSTPLEKLVRKKAAMFRGVLIGSVKQFEEMVRLINANGIKPVVDKVFPFDKVVDAYQYMEAQKHVGKIVIKVA